MSDKRIEELDGLRGLAAVTVVIAHYFGEVAHGLRALTIGWYAVDFFFVLSGFLMGSIILRRCGEKGFLKAFYLRRAARILPIYCLVVTITIALAGMTQGHEWSDRPFPAAVYYLFITNFAMSFSEAGSEWLLPTWTLSVEEQFYIALPLLLWLTPRRLLPGLLCLLVAAALLFRCLVRPENEIAALTLLPARMDLLLAGVAVALAAQRADLSRYLSIFRIVPLVAVLTLLVVALTSRQTLFPLLSPTLLAIGFASFLLAVLHGAPEGARYRSPWLQYFGRISFALYLIHQPVSGLMHGLLLDGKPDIATFAQISVALLSFAVSVGLASASWVLIEAPILKRVPVVALPSQTAHG